MAEQSLIRVQNVSKTFGSRGFRPWFSRKSERKVRGLIDVSLELRPCEVVGLLGPNGAGKTTLINVICDLIRPDSGSVNVLGRRVPDVTGETQRKLGLLNSNERSFFWRLTGRQNLEFFAAMQQMKRSQIRPRVHELLEGLGLSADADRRFFAYSAGMKKRLAVARTLLHRPTVFLMDEATNSLDAEAMEDMFDLVRSNLATAGRGVLWATHRLDEVLMLCDRVVVLLDGRVAFEGPCERFKQVCVVPSEYRIDLEAPSGLRAKLEQLTRSLDTDIEYAGDLAHITLRGMNDASTLSSVQRQLLERGVTIQRMEPVPLSLNKAFAQLTSPATRDQDKKEPNGDA